MFYLQVSKDSLFNNNLIIDNKNISDNYYQFNDSPLDLKLFWRVGYYSNNNVIWSETRSYSIKDTQQIKNSVLIENNL